MGRIFVDGFESNHLGLWDASSGVTIAAAQSGMSGNYCAYLGASGYVVLSFPALSEVYVGFKYRATNAWHANRGNVLSFCGKGAMTGKVWTWPNTGIMTFLLGDTSTATVLGRPISLGVTYRIEVRYKPHDTNGIFQLKVDGRMVIDYSGDTTSGGATVDEIRIGWEGSVGGPNAAYVDDVVIDDSNWPGDGAVAGIVPTGAGESAEWTPSAGSNYACVDEIPPSDSDYLTTNTAGDKDTYQAGNMPAGAVEVVCAQFAARAQREGLSTPTRLAFVARLGGTDYDGPSKNLPTLWTTHTRDLWVNNPASAQAFTAGEIDGIEIGIKAVA